MEPLFDVTRTTVAVCIICGAVREPTEAKATACRYDLDRAEYGVQSHRPKKCLNTWQPTDSEIPY